MTLMFTPSSASLAATPGRGCALPEPHDRHFGHICVSDQIVKVELHPSFAVFYRRLRTP